MINVLRAVMVSVKERIHSMFCHYGATEPSAHYSEIDAWETCQCPTDHLRVNMIFGCSAIKNIRFAVGNILVITSIMVHVLLGKHGHLIRPVDYPEAKIHWYIRQGAFMCRYPDC